MSNVVPFNEGTQLPAHLQALAASGMNTDLSSGVSTGFATVSFKGKVWHVVQGDDRTLLTNPATGDPMQAIEVVILKANPHLSKIYYAKGYEEGSTAKPDCYSNDSITPAMDAQSPQAPKCAVCPHNAWGSRVSEHGAKGKACSDSRRLAIAPVDDLEHPMLLRIPAATLKELTNYAQMLDRRRAPYTAVVTRIGFDHTVAHPKLTFKAARWVSAEEAALVADVAQRDVVMNICGLGSTAPTAQTVQQGQDDFDLPPPPQHIAEPTPQPAPKYAVSEEDVSRVVSAAPPPEQVPAPPPVQDSKVSAIIADADQSLDAALRLLDDHDD